MFMSRFFTGPSSDINPSFVAALSFVSSSTGIRTVTMALASAGTATATGDTPPNWSSPAYSGVGSEWSVRFSHTGTNLTFSGTEGSWLSLSSGASISFSNNTTSNLGTGTLTMEFSRDSGATIAATKTASINIGYDPAI